MVYMLTLGYIDGIHVTIYSSTMDPMGYGSYGFIVDILVVSGCHGGSLW